MSAKHWPQLTAACAALALAACAAPPGPACPPGAQAMTQDTLYMGLLKPKGGAVSEDDWTRFMDDTVTPRFPQGLTVLRADGQWRGKDGVIVKEPSRVLMLLHEGDARSQQAVAEIASTYQARFEQEAVLRVRSPACVNF